MGAIDLPCSAATLDKGKTLRYNESVNPFPPAPLQMMKQYCVLGVLAFLVPVLLVAADVKKDHAFSDFMRVTKKEGQRLATSYDIAIMQFMDEKKEIQVDLIGAVHVGDAAYYEELNDIFKRYDVVLYELVADADTRPERNRTGDEPKSVLSAFQSAMGNALALEHQLDYIDYHAKNLVHADLSPAEFARRVADRGDLVQMFYRMMVLGIQKSNDPDAQRNEMRMQGRLLGSLLVSDPALSLKRVLADEMMSQLDEAGWIIGGEASAIITDRNEAALQVLRREIAGGKKKIAIFYGAAHMPEFAKSLEKDFQMKKSGIEWVIAWDLTRDRSAREQQE